MSRGPAGRRFHPPSARRGWRRRDRRSAGVPPATRDSALDSGADECRRHGRGAVVEPDVGQTIRTAGDRDVSREGAGYRGEPVRECSVGSSTGFGTGAQFEIRSGPRVDSARRQTGCSIDRQVRSSDDALQQAIEGVCESAGSSIRRTDRRYTRSGAGVLGPLLGDDRQIEFRRIVETSNGSTWTPGRSRSPSGAFWSANITWKSGERLRSRWGASASTIRSNGTS